MQSRILSPLCLMEEMHHLEEKNEVILNLMGQGDVYHCAASSLLLQSRYVWGDQLLGEECCFILIWYSIHTTQQFWVFFVVFFIWHPASRLFYEAMLLEWMLFCLFGIVLLKDATPSPKKKKKPCLDGSLCYSKTYFYLSGFQDSWNFNTMYSRWWDIQSLRETTQDFQLYKLPSSSKSSWPYIGLNGYGLWMDGWINFLIWERKLANLQGDSLIWSHKRHISDA